MKKSFLLLLLLGLLGTSFSQPVMNLVEAPEKVSIYDKYEASFTLGFYHNPYDPEVIDVYADFTAPDGRTFRVIGFYYEGYRFEEEDHYEVALRERDVDCWKVRFTPDLPGDWTYEIHAEDPNGWSYCTGSFHCQPKVSAKGFIRLANCRFLKREVVANGEAAEHSFFPVGPNIAWYTCADLKTYQKPYGIYEYERYIDSLNGNCNYMRVWVNRYQYLSLYGPEHTEIDGKRFVTYFDSMLNQKDSGELDFIVDYAARHDIAIMLSIFNIRDFTHTAGVSENKTSNPKTMLSDWNNNPYHTILGLESPFDFFSDPEAKRITKNLLRYIVARWGYAPNIMNWELWNEIANISQNVTIDEQYQNDIVAWHSEMADYLRSIDPFHHLVSTSPGATAKQAILGTVLFDGLDFSQKHLYQNFQNARSNEQYSYGLMKLTRSFLNLYPDMPFFAGEFGFSLSNPKHTYYNSDPKYIELHNSLWSSLFSGSMGPASFWYWDVLTKMGMYRRFRPVTTFCDGLPLLSDTYTGMTTGTDRGQELVFPNGLRTYYMMNAAEDSIFGWSQDTLFSYQSLRRRTDYVGSDRLFAEDGTFDTTGYVYTMDPAKRPSPSSFSNRIALPINNQRRGTRYLVQWYDAETGRELRDERAEVIVRRSLFRGKRIVVDFPSSIRNILGSRVNNRFGDAVFVITKINE